MAAESLLEKMHFLLKRKRDQGKRFAFFSKKHFETKACSAQPELAANSNSLSPIGK